MSSFFTWVSRARTIAMRPFLLTCPIALVAVALVPSSSAAGQSRTVGDGVYTDAQAARGQGLFNQHCALCHGDSLQGGAGPELVGTMFTGDFNKGPLSDLVDLIRVTMPEDKPGTLNQQQASDVTAYILKANKFPAGRVDLSADTAAQKQITWPAAAAAATTNAQASSGTPQAPAWALTGNMLQLMRGAFFQNSNIIFNVQTHDPGAKVDPAAQKAAGTALDWVGWGSNIYTGWDAVDNAAVALAEIAPLLLTPGRRCQNGKPVPVDRADWIKFSMDMLEAARKSFKASQTRNQEAVSDSTNDLSDSCLACHQVYRDKRSPGGQPGDPASMALRCTP